MATCKDCLHVEACEFISQRQEKLMNDFFNEQGREISVKFGLPDAEKCPYFKDRSRFVELPCEVGDTLYMAISDRQIVLSAVVTEININEASLVIKAAEKITYTMLAFIPSNFGSTVFTTKEEAEQALTNKNQPDNTP